MTVWGWRRILLALPVGALAALAIAFAGVERAVDADEMVPYLWTVLCAVASVLVFAVMLFPGNRMLFRLAGALALTAVGTRPLGVFANYLFGFTRSGWSVIVSTVIYPSWAMLAALWWFDRVGPWQVRHQLRATVEGD